MEALLRDLGNNNNNNNNNKKKTKNYLEKKLNNACIFFEGREMIINAFETGFSPLPKRPSSFLRRSLILRTSYNVHNKGGNNELVNMFRSELSDLRDEIQKMSEDEKRKILTLKILTPDQMFNRLPITLAQLKAGNNSEKLKNEIRNYCILCLVQKK